MGESVKCRIECIQTFIEWILVKLSNEYIVLHCRMNIVVNYRMNIRKLSNEYCNTSNGSVQNYLMNISNLSNGYCSNLSNE